MKSDDRVRRNDFSFSGERRFGDVFWSNAMDSLSESFTDSVGLRCMASSRHSKARSPFPALEKQLFRRVDLVFMVVKVV